MDKYIDAEAAIEIIEEKQKELCPAGLFRRSLVHGRDLDVWDDLEAMIDRIRDIPDADVAPVRHGRWVLIRPGEWTATLKCSECGRHITVDPKRDDLEIEYPYCHCGAKMDA